jgi:hypothetical protein
MLRVIHFFNLKPGADEERVLPLLNNDLADHTIRHGCLERRTLKLLDADGQGQPVPAASYLNEALWPSLQVSDAWIATLGADERWQRLSTEIDNSIEFMQRLRYRYVDEAG